MAIHDAWIHDARLDRLDDNQFLGRVLVSVGAEARADCALVLHAIRCESRLNPYARVHVVDSSEPARIASLYERASTASPIGGYFDQRLINYLSANLDQVERIHWRQFERLIAEYLYRQGYHVELGPGGNDDGVDIRMWPQEPKDGTPPLVIVQCKRSRAKVEKLVVKALWSDVLEYGARRGLVATTARLSPGAQGTIHGRGYGIDVVDADALSHLLEVMKTPGAGLWLAD